MNELTTEDLEQSAKSPVLGPAYFAARRVSEAVMKDFDPEAFKPILDKITQQINDELWGKVESCLLCDTECNIQGHIHRMVDDTVRAILKGDHWALERYAAAKNHDGEAVRAAVLKHGGEMVKAGRIADLEKEVARLTESLKLYQNRY